MRAVQSFRVKPEARLKLKLVAMAKGKTMGILLEEMIEKLWDSEQDTVSRTLTKRVTRDVQRFIGLMMKPGHKTYSKNPPRNLLTN
jgi:predicted DNA-binding protein